MPAGALEPALPDRLLAPARGLRGGLRRRVVPHQGRRALRRGRLRLVRGPGRRRHHRRGLPDRAVRGRVGLPRAPGRPRARPGGQPRRGQGQRRQAVHRPQRRPRAERRCREGDPDVRPRAPERLRLPAQGRVRRRPAQDADRQDPPDRVAPARVGERGGMSVDTKVSSFSKALMLGEIHEELVFPYPKPDPEEAEKVRGLIAGFRDYADAHIDPVEIDRTGTIETQTYRDLGDLGLMGLYVDEEYGGQGLSQTGYARVFEAIGQVDGSLTIGMGVHQSIGFKGIHMYGTDEQKARFLPDLAGGRKLAGFALTEPEAGSDAYNIQSRAVEQADGSWVLNG